MAVDPLDIISTAEARIAINMDADNTEHTAEIEQFVTAISRRFDEVIGPVVNRTVTEYHDGGVAAIWPRQTPVASVTTVKEWDGTTTTTLTADSWGTAGNTDGYLLEESGSYAHDARIFRRSGGSNALYGTGQRSIELVYEAGRAADTTSVDKRIKAAVGMVLRRMWKREAGMWAVAPSFLDNTDPELGTVFFKAVDPMIAEMLPDETKPPAVA